MDAAERDRALFLVKDPHWTFIWWRINQEHLNQVAAQMEGEVARLTLRIHNVTGIIFDGSNSRDSFDVEVTDDTDHWYLHIPVSGQDYCVEVGLKTEGGRFYLLVRSNTLILPRDGPAPNECWSTITV